MFSIRAQTGMTLIELMVVTVIAAMIITVGIPSLQRFSQNIGARQDIGRLSQLLSYARSSAIFTTSRTTLCPLKQDNSCSQDWNEALSLFSDTNNNHKLDLPQEAVLSTIAAVSTNNVTRAYTGTVISFNERGYSDVATGSMSYCKNDAIITGAVFIISRMGRIRRGQDSDNDGLPETAGGSKIPCSR